MLGGGLRGSRRQLIVTGNVFHLHVYTVSSGGGLSATPFTAVIPIPCVSAEQLKAVTLSRWLFIYLFCQRMQCLYTASPMKGSEGLFGLGEWNNYAVMAEEQDRVSVQLEWRTRPQMISSIPFKIPSETSHILIISRLWESRLFHDNSFFCVMHFFLLFFFCASVLLLFLGGCSRHQLNISIFSVCVSQVYTAQHIKMNGLPLRDHCDFKRSVGI